MAEEHLLLEKLASGDRPAIYAAGLFAAQALKEGGCAVFMVDVLGRVHLLPPAVVEVKARPRLEDEVLHALSEDEAMALMVRQGDEEEAIIDYMKRRAARQG